MLPGMKDTAPVAWLSLDQDQPIEKLTRWKITGEHILGARVFLEKGCVVPVHSHPSEQLAIMISGHGRWTFGDGRIVEQLPGEVLMLPGGFEHGIEALEDTLIIDILSPPGAMGVDRQE
jgi:quercetin dioxygenase-like cupin family protein